MVCLEVSSEVVSWSTVFLKLIVKIKDIILHAIVNVHAVDKPPVRTCNRRWFL